MITLFFIMVAAFLSARADIQKASLRSSDTTFTLFVASLCLSIVLYPALPIINPMIDFVLYFFEYFVAYDIGYLILRNATKRGHTF